MQWCSIGPLDILQSGSQSQGLQEVRMHPAANSTSECKKGCSGSPLSLTYLLCNWGTVTKMCLIIHCRHHPKKHVAVHQLLLCIVFFQRCQLCSSTGIRALNVVSVARIAYPLLLLSSMSQECFESRKGKSCQRAHARFTHTASVYSIHLLPSTNIPALSLAFVPAASCWFCTQALFHTGTRWCKLHMPSTQGACKIAAGLPHRRNAGHRFRHSKVLLGLPWRLDKTHHSSKLCEILRDDR